MAASIDENAPVTTSQSIEINAPIETVWTTISQVEHWPDWNPEIRDVEVDGPLAPGTNFKWKAGPGTIRSTLKTVDAPTEISWQGKTMGITALHVYRLQQAGEVVELSTEESWDGLLPRLLRSLMQKTLDESIRLGLVAAKDRAESEAEKRTGH